MKKDSPAFYHETVLLNEAVDGLAIQPEGIYVDVTFGGGGHSREILSRLNAKGRLVAFDQDQDAWRNAPDDERLIPVRENFRYLKRFLRLQGFSQVDGILADLGVSSYHFDTAERGFSTRFDGPLDMRMDSRTETTAAKILHEYSADALQDMFSKYGEVRNAKQLSQHLIAHRTATPISSTGALKNLIKPVVKGIENKYYAQVFQALRIAVNEEMKALEELLEEGYQCLKPNGRMSIITFHSLEDRLVKQYFKSNNVEQDLLKGNKNEPKWKLINNKPILPTKAEQERNSRARSAKLRIAEKL